MCVESELMSAVRVGPGSKQAYTLAPFGSAY